MRLEAGDTVRADERVVARSGGQIEAITEGELDDVAGRGQPEPDRAI